MEERDLIRTRAIFQTAFATFLGVPNPETFQSDRECIFTRWLANREAALVAEVPSAEGGPELAGSNFLANWGSFGFFGPLTIRPEFWNRGIAQHLLAGTMELFEQWGIRETGLFTFPHSTKHIALYQKFGFWPRFLTAVMSKNISTEYTTPWTGLSALDEGARAEAVGACRELTDSIYAGLDVSGEIRSVLVQKLGETVLLWGGERLDGFAVCYCGDGTEAGADNCYVKFAAARPGPSAGTDFRRLLEACASLALRRGLHRVEAGVNMGRSEAYRAMLQAGFRTQMQGVAMHRPDAAGYNRPDVFAIDDWR
jgi:GNAT superfamily N-acetyltransferase